MRIPFAVHSYQAASLPLSAQSLINLYPEQAPPDAKARLALYGTPGLKSFATAGQGPIRGMHAFAGTLCAVSGGDFYTVASDGTAARRGTVKGDATAVSMADSGTQLVIVSGPLAADAYTWNGTTLAAIADADADFPGSADVAYIDGYHVFLRDGTGQFFNSALRDATNYDALDIGTAEASPDKLVAVESDHRDLWLMGETTIEIWYNSGVGNPPFDQVTNALIERGCLARHSVVKEDNTVFWLGDDKIVYRAEGYTPRRVSTHAIEGAIAGYASPADAQAFSYSENGHKFYILTFPEATWVYDIAMGVWHQRESRDPKGNSLNRWRVGHGVHIYGKNLVGDYATGAIYELDPDTYTENGTTIRRVATSPPIHANGRRARMSRLQVEIESGVGLTSGQGSDPQAMLDWSDDGGRTWSGEHWAAMGRIGAYRARAVWRRLGQFRERTLRLTISDPVKTVIIAADADVR